MTREEFEKAVKDHCPTLIKVAMPVVRNRAKARLVVLTAVDDLSPQDFDNETSLLASLTEAVKRVSRERNWKRGFVLPDPSDEVQEAIKLREKDVSWDEVATGVGVKKKVLQKRVYRYQRRIGRRASSQRARKKQAETRRKTAVPITPRPLKEPQPRRESLPPELLHPVTLQVRRHLRSGGTLTPCEETILKLRCSPETHDKIVSWFKEGDIETLADLLRANPATIAHPVVFWQIFHLKRLVHMTDAETLREVQKIGASVDPDAPILPVEMKRTARQALQRLLTAWVPQILPGYTAEPIRLPKRRGAPRQTDELEVLDLLFEFNSLHERLSELYERSPEFFLREADEASDRWLDRIVRLVQELHLNSWRSAESYRVPGEPEFDASGELNLSAWHIRNNPLPTDAALTIAKKAVKKRRVSKNALVHGLLAHYTGKSLGQVRGTIERAEADWPDLARRR